MRIVAAGAKHPVGADADLGARRVAADALAEVEARTVAVHRTAHRLAVAAPVGVGGLSRLHPIDGFAFVADAAAGHDVAVADEAPAVHRLEAMGVALTPRNL